LDEDVAASVRFRRVYEAEKRLWLDEAADRQAASRRLVSLALKDPAPRTIVFVESPEEALVRAREIGKTMGSDRVALMTGTMRGRERDELRRSEAFQPFLGPIRPEKPVVLVATSAAEVGVNLTCERLVTMLVPSDQMLQRFGRLNRFGDQDGEPHRAGDAYVVFVEPKDKDSETPIAKTLAYLHGLPAQANGSRDISCQALRQNPPAPDTHEGDPPVAPLHPWILDVWAHTSIPDSAVPPVEHWLHGRREGEPAEAEVAWRWEAEWLSQEGVDEEDLRRVFERLPVTTRERLHEPAKRVREKLNEIAAKAPDTAGLLISRDGEVCRVSLADLGEDDLDYSLIVLPPKVGGIERGMFTIETTPDSPYDIAEADGRRFYVKAVDDNEWEWRATARNSPPERGPDPRKEKAGATFVEIPRGADTEEAPHLYVLVGTPNEKRARYEVDLDHHLSAALRHAETLAGRLLPNEVQCFKAAAMAHDLGKSHPLWQTAMGGDIEHPKAKTLRARDPRLLEGFRHELRSVVLASGECCSTGLHLVGSHHGWSRPHFEARAYDPNEPEASKAAALEGARRFGMLQARYGHWGLAYLEAVFKAIDGIASEEGENA
jgi:CRISPR-associated endonuclease/helicase Cas3